MNPISDLLAYRIDVNIIFPNSVLHTKFVARPQAMRSGFVLRAFGSAPKQHKVSPLGLASFLHNLPAFSPPFSIFITVIFLRTQHLCQNV